MSHFSRADELDCPRTEEQLAAFAAASQGLEGEISLRNSQPCSAGRRCPAIGYVRASCSTEPRRSSAHIRWPTACAGDDPGIEGDQRPRPAGRRTGRLRARYSTERSQRIGVVAMGYADGYPRHAADGTLVFIDGKPGRLVGRVSMDMLTVDLTDHPQAGLAAGSNYGARTCRSAPWRRSSAAFPTTAVQPEKGAARLFRGLRKTFRILCAGMSTDLL